MYLQLLHFYLTLINKNFQLNYIILWQKVNYFDRKVKSYFICLIYIYINFLLIRAKLFKLAQHVRQIRPKFKALTALSKAYGPFQWPTSEPTAHWLPTDWFDELETSIPRLLTWGTDDFDGQFKNRWTRTKLLFALWKY